MIKASFYIPANFNDNKPIPASCFAELEKFLIVEFGGYTLAGRVEGAWMNPETEAVAKDVSVKYEVALNPESVNILRDFLAKFKSKIKQDAIYFEVDKDTEIEML